MSIPTEHKTIKSYTLTYTQEIGWSVEVREEAEERRVGRVSMGDNYHSSIMTIKYYIPLYIVTQCDLYDQ
jgi:hypothetical protein